MTNPPLTDEKLHTEVCALLAGHNRDTQAHVIVQVLGRLLSGYPDEAREEVMRMTAVTAVRLAHLYELEARNTIEFFAGMTLDDERRQA